MRSRSRPPRRRSAGCSGRSPRPSSASGAPARTWRRSGREPPPTPRWPRSSATRRLVEEARLVADETRAAVEEAKAALDAPRAALQAARSESVRHERPTRRRSEPWRRCELAGTRSSWGWPRGDGGAALLAADLAGVLGPLAASLQVVPGCGAGRGRRARPDRRVGRGRRRVDTAVDALELLRARRPAGPGRSSVGAPAARPGGASAPGSARARAVGGGRPSWSSVPERLRPVVERVLAGVVVVADLDAARQVVERHPELRAVTTRGRSRRRPRSPVAARQGGTSVLQVRAALDEAVADLADAEATAERSTAAFDEAVAAEQAAQAAVEAAQARVSEAQAAVSTAQAGLSSAQAALDQVRARQREADQRGAAAARRLAQLEAAADAAARRGRAAGPERHRRPGGPRRWPGGAGRAGDPAGGGRILPGAGDRADHRDARRSWPPPAQTARQREVEARLAVRTAEERVQASRAGRTGSIAGRPARARTSAPRRPPARQAQAAGAGRRGRRQGAAAGARAPRDVHRARRRRA